MTHSTDLDIRIKDTTPEALQAMSDSGTDHPDIAAIYDLLGEADPNDYWMSGNRMIGSDTIVTFTIEHDPTTDCAECERAYGPRTVCRCEE